MNHIVRTASAAAYREIATNGIQASATELILATVSDAEGMTRKEISRATGLEINQVAGRVNEMVKSGQLKEGEHKRKCRVTGRLVGYVRTVKMEEGE